jgi:FkbM family methyltransferase
MAAPLGARHRLAHVRWLFRRSRADRADRRHRAFRYVHPIAGPFVYHPSDYLSRRLFLYDDFERGELQFAVEQARAGGLILDVGANTGLYAVACARAAASRGRVLALEPAPGTFEKLVETCARLGLSNVTPLPVAASRARGTARLVVRHDGRDVHQHLADALRFRDADAVEVQTLPLDEVCGSEWSAVTLLKLDVEGHEVAALEGATRILGNGRARLVVEVFPAGLAAAGASSERLWTLLAATHECVGIVCRDGSTRPPGVDRVASGDVEEVFNTLWVPRQAPAGREETPC